MLSGATIEEFKELNKEFDTRDGFVSQNADSNQRIAKKMEGQLPQAMTGYPPEVIRYEQRQVEVQGMLADLPMSEREFYSGALAVLNTSYRLEKDSENRIEIEKQFSGMERAIRNQHARVINDPVDRTLGIFNAPMGEGYMNKFDRQRVDTLERYREDFLDAPNATERKAILSKAVELKSSIQGKINFSLSIVGMLDGGRWEEANKEVDRILQEARAQTDPAKRYELVGRQLFQINPGHDDLKDRTVLAFTQRMRDSEPLRNELYAWHAQVSKPLNAEAVSGPKKYTDILKDPPLVGPDYVRDLSDQYTNVLRDAGEKNYSITPEAKARRQATQVLEGVMRVLFELSPIGPLADLIPSTLPDNVRTGIEFGGMILGALTGAGIGKLTSRAAEAVAASAKAAELDDVAGAGVRVAGKGLVDDSVERMVKEAADSSVMSTQAQAAAEALKKKALAEAGPLADPTSVLAHQAIGLDSPHGSLVTYADKDVNLASLHQGSRPGVLEDAKGDRFIELGGKAYHVRFDNDNSTWRVFDKENRYRPQFPVRLDEATNTWGLHSDVGLRGGVRKISQEVRQKVINLLNEGNMSRLAIAEELGISRPSVVKIAEEENIGLSAPGSLRSLPLTPALKEEAVGLLREGNLTRAEIAERLEISRAAVSKIAKDNDITPARKAVSRAKITPEIRAQVQQLFEERKYSDVQIATRVGISRASVINLRRELHLSPAATLRSRKVTPAMETDIIAQIQGGVPAREVAQANGVSASTVWRISRKIEVPVSRRPVTEEQMDRIFELRNQGLSAQNVAETVGLSQKKIEDIYANVNLDTYKRSWWDTTPVKRTATLSLLDQGRNARDVAREMGLPVDTVRGLANQQRFARDSLAVELLSQGEAPETVADTLGIGRPYLDRLNEGVPRGTHDIHTGSENVALAMDMFGKGYTREEVAEKLGISRWRARSLANEFSAKTMDSVMPQQLRDLVRALSDQDHTFTTGELARGTGLPESTVAVVEHEYEMGSIVTRQGSPVAGPSSSTASHGTDFEWVRPLTLEQEKQAIRAMGEGQPLETIAQKLNVDRAAIERLSEDDLPYTSPTDDTPVPSTSAAPAPAGRPSTIPALTPLTDQDRDEIRGLSRRDQLSSGFIADLFEIPVEVVESVLRSR
ncbi:Helix-turn-helix domain of resolvase [Caballeronia pedi]|uniref:Helix-turn-helix domain of resolvase n=1 Tax=Caballeronia pedi TaxID=1777141 RepID=A0A158CBH1_9BURK|nr:hypothetical protein [Caballeronia pedi]SAK79708.1 Helix-turn-helix domain of resolvase [Caballeronia pedi]